MCDHKSVIPVIRRIMCPVHVKTPVDLHTGNKCLKCRETVPIATTVEITSLCLDCQSDIDRKEKKIMEMHQMAVRQSQLVQKQLENPGTILATDTQAQYMMLSDNQCRCSSSHYIHRLTGLEYYTDWDNEGIYYPGRSH